MFFTIQREAGLPFMDFSDGVTHADLTHFRRTYNLDYINVFIFVCNNYIS